MPSRRRFLAAGSTAAVAGFAGCSGLPFGGDSVPLGDDYPAAEDVPRTGAWTSFRGDGANTACVPDADPIDDPGVDWESPEFTTEHRVPWRTVTVDGATAYAGGESLHAFDVLSGDAVWTNDDVFAPRVAPDVHDGVLWTNDGAASPRVAGVDAASGEVSVRRDLGADLYRAPSVTADTPYVVAPTDGGVAGALVDLDDAEPWQEPRWRHELFGDGAFRPATTTGVVVVSHAGELYRFGAAGTPVWRVPLRRRPRSQPVVGDDRVYVATRYGAVALDRETGAREWEYRGVGGDAAGDSDRAEVKRAAVAFDGQRLVLAAEHALHAVSAATGEQRWTHRFEDEVGALPAIGGGRVYVGTRTDVHALSMDGTHRWRFDVGDPFGATLAVTQGRLVTVRDAGTSEGMRVVSVA